MASIGVKLTEVRQHLWPVLRALPLATITLGAGTWLIGSHLTRPAPSPVGKPPPDVESFELDSAITGHRPGVIRGLQLTHDDAKGSLLLVHGLRGNRRAMWPRMQLFHHIGFDAYATDLQAHGESDGDELSFGVFEAQGIRDAVARIAAQSPAPRVVVGLSLGGASALLALPDLPADALVLEAVFENLPSAIANRFESRFPGAGALAPLLTWQEEWRFGRPARDISPVRAIKSARVPTLILAGDADTRTTSEDTRALFAPAPLCKRLVWFVRYGSFRLVSVQPALIQRRCDRIFAGCLRWVSRDYEGGTPCMRQPEADPTRRTASRGTQPAS